MEFAFECYMYVHNWILIYAISPNFWTESQLSIIKRSEDTTFLNKQADELPQRQPRDAPYIWVSWKFSRVPEYAHGYFSKKI